MFPGPGYKNSKVYPLDRESRLSRGDYWIKTLRTSSPYGLNKRKRKADPNLPVGYLFPPIPR